MNFNLWFIFSTEIPFVKKASNEVHFELTSQSTGASILVKHFSPTACLMLPVQKYLSLTDAADIKSTICNVWAVVRNFVKVLHIFGGM